MAAVEAVERVDPKTHFLKKAFHLGFSDYFPNHRFLGVLIPELNRVDRDHINYWQGRTEVFQHVYGQTVCHPAFLRLATTTNGFSSLQTEIILITHSQVERWGMEEYWPKKDPGAGCFLVKVVQKSLAHTRTILADEPELRFVEPLFANFPAMTFHFDELKQSRISQLPEVVKPTDLPLWLETEIDLKKSGLYFPNPEETRAVLRKVCSLRDTLLRASSGNIGCDLSSMQQDFETIIDRCRRRFFAQNPF